MKNEKIYSSEIKIIINKSSYKIFYLYNNKTTFQDLLEYLARLIPFSNICDCYEFAYSGQKSSPINEKIPKDSLIINYSKKLDKLYLNKKNINCEHSINNYLKGTKKDIYSFFQSGQDTIINLENKINKLEEDLKLKKNEADDIYDINDIGEKINNIYEEIKDLKEKLKRFPFILEKGEKLMSIIISTRDEKMLYSLPCKNNNTINDIEKKLYKEFPEYSDNKIIFLNKGKIIDKDETFQKNNIKNENSLILELANNLNIGIENIKKKD